MSTATAGIDDVAASYYLVKDLDRATEFYTRLFGAGPSMTMEGMLSEWSFPSGASFGLYRPGDGSFRPYGGVMFNVPEVKAALEAAKAAGATFEDDDVTETPVCFMAFGEDSEGNSFALHQPKT